MSKTTCMCLCHTQPPMILLEYNTCNETNNRLKAVHIHIFTNCKKYPVGLVLRTKLGIRTHGATGALAPAATEARDAIHSNTVAFMRIKLTYVQGIPSRGLDVLAMRRAWCNINTRCDEAAANSFSGTTPGESLTGSQPTPAHHPHMRGTAGRTGIEGSGPPHPARDGRTGRS